MSHTPGPWVSAKYERGNEIATVALIGDYVAGVPTPGIPGGNYRDTNYGTDEADARLIAAAPEMLAALKALEEWGGKFVSRAVGTDAAIRHPFIGALRNASVAIDKATGAK